MKSTHLIISLLFLTISTSAKIVNYETDAGAVADNDDLTHCWLNGMALNSTLAALKPGDTLLIPNKTYHVMGGVIAVGL